MVQTDRRERKKARIGRHISDVATGLFAARGFDDVSVSEIAEAADVARPTVFAHFPRKEDLVFDRTEAVTAALVQAGRADGPPLQGIRELLAASGTVGGFGASVSEQRPFWQLVAGSRALQARARELAEHLESVLADVLAERGLAEPALCAAFVAAAYRSAHLAAIGRVLAGDPPEQVETERTARLGRAFDAAEHAITRLQQAT